MTQNHMEINPQIIKKVATELLTITQARISPQKEQQMQQAVTAFTEAQAAQDDAPTDPNIPNRSLAQALTFHSFFHLLRQITNADNDYVLNRINSMVNCLEGHAMAENKPNLYGEILRSFPRYYREASPENERQAGIMRNERIDLILRIFKYMDEYRNIPAHQKPTDPEILKQQQTVHDSTRQFLNAICQGLKSEIKPVGAIEIGTQQRDVIDFRPNLS